MARPSIPSSTQAAVLVSSRRRCCICFGLNRDTSLKSGQIAHLDHNNSNNAETNLAFLCFHHHDEYDSTASQRKNFTIPEVKQYRKELVESLGSALSQRVHFGAVSVPPSDPYAGQYIRVGYGSSSAQITVTPVPDSIIGEPRYVITGIALHGIEREFGPNMGVLEFLGAMVDKAKLVYLRSNGDDMQANTTLIFQEDGQLEVDEDSFVGQYGMGVTFAGSYQRAID